MCPNASCNFSCTCRFDSPRVFTISFRTLACFPAALLTPHASYITIKANIRVTANIGESTPKFFPISVARAITIAE